VTLDNYAYFFAAHCMSVFVTAR